MQKTQIKRRRSRMLLLCTLLAAVGLSSLSGCIVVDRGHYHHWHRWN